MKKLSPEKVTIFLRDGFQAEGVGFGDFSKPILGEFVFCTSMSGIEESLTDPSYCQQILVSTSSHVGNTGINFDDMESSKIWAEGLICRNLTLNPSNWRSKKSLVKWVVEENKFLISKINTRGLTLFLRDKGSQLGVVVSSKSAQNINYQELINSNKDFMSGSKLVNSVSAKDRDFKFNKNEYWPIKNNIKKSAKALTVAVWDFGVKRNTIRLLNSLGCKVRFFPANSKSEDLLTKDIDFILLSNGPGDPASCGFIYEELKKILGKKPIFSICLGHQLIAHSFGISTFKMEYGHRGIHHPVKQLNHNEQVEKVWITSQNHGYAVAEEKIPFNGFVSFRHADDDSIEGISVPELKLRTVQFHPEVAPGPFDSASLINNFIEEVVVS